jgi:arylformamidase
MAQGASVNVSTITTSPHVGTHADAPLHVKADAAAADQLPLSAFHGPVTIIDVAEHTGVIPTVALDTLFDDASITRLILKTGRTVATGIFPESWPALTPECVRALTGRGLVLLGVDCPSVDDRDSKTLDVHHALFDNGAVILENLDLRAVAPGNYELSAFPAKFTGLDAAPVRAVLTAVDSFNSRSPSTVQIR